MTPRKFAGLALGLAGVALITRGGPVPVNAATLAAIAGGSQLLAGLLCAPALFSGPASAVYSAQVLFHITLVGLVCGSLAYLLYYRLVTLAGPVKALSVTFLIPVFGMLWGHLFLGEVVTPGMLGGCATVLAGLVLLFSATPDIRATTQGSGPKQP